jgi:hypothetical protein
MHTPSSRRSRIEEEQSPPDVPPKSNKHRRRLLVLSDRNNMRVRRSLFRDHDRVIGDHAAWSDASLPYSSVAATLGLKEGSTGPEDVQEAREMLCINWAHLKRTTDSLRGPLDLVLATGGEAHDPASRTLGSDVYATRRAQQRLLAGIISLCGPVFEKLEHVFAMEDLVVLPNAITCLGYISSVGETIIASTGSGEWDALAALMKWSRSAFYQDHPLKLLNAITGLSCLSGLRISPEHWSGYTVPRFSHDCTSLEYIIPANSKCTICHEVIGSGEENSDGMIIMRRCSSIMVSPGVRVPCGGHTCKCFATQTSPVYYHTDCMGQHFYIQGSEGRARCPTCSAAFCLLDMTRLTFKPPPPPRNRRREEGALPKEGWIHSERRVKQRKRGE